MQATPNLNFTAVTFTKEWLQRFVTMIRSVYENLVNVINGNLGFGDGTKADNISGAWINVTAPAAPSTNFTVTHNLGRLPVGYWVMQKDRACDVFTGTIAATKTQLTLQATVGSAVLRLFIVMLLLSLIPFGLKAQTTVNLTVQDTPDNQTWNNGTWSATLKAQAGQAGGPPFNIISGGGSTAPQNGALSVTGTATMSLPANSNIAPAHSVWLFQACPLASSPCVTQEVVVSTSSPQTLNITPPSPRINMFTAPPPVTAYLDGELTGVVIGNTYFNSISLVHRYCVSASSGTCFTWQNVGTGSTVPGGSPIQTQVNNGGVFGGTPCESFTALGAGPINWACNVAPASSVNVSLKPGTATAVQYVASTGNDSLDGFSWGTAKLTISAACAALPGGNSGCTAGNGQIYASAGYAVVLPAGTTPNVQLIHYQPAIQSGTNASPVPGPTASPIPNGIDIREFGGRVFFSPTQTITVTTNGTNSVTTTGLADFQAGDDLVIGAAGPATAQTSPAAPTVQVIGATGSSTVSYECVGIDTQWGLTTASPSTSTAVAPQVFGQPAVGISSATWVANVVTVNTSSAMPFSSGSFHVMIPQITSSGNQIGGIELATIVNSTQLTYALTGSGTVTVGSGAAVLFVNGFVLTQVSETAGSNQIILTTDVNHNLQQQLGANHPTELFLDGINFPGEGTPGYANGVFTILSVTSNTITVVTPHIALLTQNATASSFFATSSVTQMTALVYPEIVVTCPQNANGVPSTGGVQYAVYANYGSGFSPIGITPYQHSIFVDYGPGNTQSGFAAPPGMNLPTTPPGAAQRQVFEGKILSISGTTLTLDRSVPQSLASVTGYHSDGISLQNAINQSCQRFDGVVKQNFYPVFMPAASGSAYFYLFNAPVALDGGNNHCGSASVIDAGAVIANGTLYTNNSNAVEWRKPNDGFNAIPGVSGGPSGGIVSWIGLASPMIAGGASWTISGMGFTTQSNGQNAVILLAPTSKVERSAFNTSASFLSSIPLIIGSTGFQARLRDIVWGDIPNPFTPTVGPCGRCGQVMWWPVPGVQIIDGGAEASMPNIVWEGANTASGLGIEFDKLYPGSISSPSTFKIENVLTFQEPWSPLLIVRGNAGIVTTRIERSQMDSVNLPVVSLLNCTSCGRLYLDQAYSISNLLPNFTGNPVQLITEAQENIQTSPSAGTNDISQSALGLTVSLPINANGGVNYTAVGFDNFNRANGAVGQNWTTIPNAGSLNVTSNQVQGNTGSDNIMVWTGLQAQAPQGIGQFSQLIMTTVASRSGPGVYLGAPAFQGYVCLETSTTLAIDLVTNGAPSASLASVGIAGNNGDVVRLEAIPTPFTTNSLTLNCYLNSGPPSVPTVSFSGVSSGQQTGYPGIDLFATTVRGDNWTGGYLPSLAGLGTEQNWIQPQHFTQPVTIGPTNPVAGTLALGLYSPRYTITGGAAPTCAVTGAGTGATCTLSSFSTDNSGAMQINSGTTPGSSGTWTLTFSAGFPNAAFCTVGPGSGGTTLNPRATVFDNTNGTLGVHAGNWDNNGVAINASQSITFIISYVCGGH